MMAPTVAGGVAVSWPTRRSPSRLGRGLRARACSTCCRRAGRLRSSGRDGRGRRRARCRGGARAADPPGAADREDIELALKVGDTGRVSTEGYWASLAAGKAASRPRVRSVLLAARGRCGRSPSRWSGRGSGSFPDSSAWGRSCASRLTTRCRLGLRRTPGRAFARARGAGRGAGDGGGLHRGAPAAGRWGDCARAGGGAGGLSRCGLSRLLGQRGGRRAIRPAAPGLLPAYGPDGGARGRGCRRRSAGPPTPPTSPTAPSIRSWRISARPQAAPGAADAHRVLPLRAAAGATGAARPGLRAVARCLGHRRLARSRA